MGLFDALFGRTRLKKANVEGVFALATAEVDLHADLGWDPAEKAALCLKPLSTRDFAQVERELEELVRLVAGESGTETDVRHDEIGYRWLIFSDPDFADLVGVVHVAGNELKEQGYGEQLLAAVFPFQTQDPPSPRYLIYGYKRGAYYPFVPVAGNRRDNACELREAALLEKWLPIEKDPSRWYPLWDPPV